MNVARNVCHPNSFPNKTINMYKLKVLLWQIKYAEFVVRVESMNGKGENVGYQHFDLANRVFKHLTLDH